MIQAERELDDIFELRTADLVNTVLVLDGDKTLANEDAGSLFWQKSGTQHEFDQTPLETLFGSSLGYSYTAFRQAVLLYEEEESNDDRVFDRLCDEIASEITIYPEFVSLLSSLSDVRNIAVVIISCGLGCVWKKVLNKFGFANDVHVIGGGRIPDRIVVTPDVKANLVTLMQDINGMYVYAFGDSPLDLKMLAQADEAIVVVGNEDTRSKAMDTALKQAISDGLVARQALIPPSSSPRLDNTILPIIEIDTAFTDAIVSCTPFQSLDATNLRAADLLVTPMRDSRLHGPVLREAHRRAGWYLAITYLPSLFGVAIHDIPHVSGYTTDGHRLADEAKTLIIALMRGGEPMASGVSDAFPLSAYVHAKVPTDVEARHIESMMTIVLVESVINTGKSVIEFIEHVQALKPGIKIVVLAGVVHRGAVGRGGKFKYSSRVDIVALRVSANGFTGIKGTDTGNRLFGTMFLE